MWPNPQLQIWSHLLKKSLMENFIFCAVYESFMLIVTKYVNYISMKSWSIIDCLQEQLRMTDLVRSDEDFSRNSSEW